MNKSDIQSEKSPVRQAIEIAINLGLIFIVLAWALLILRPFISLIIWAGIIAIAAYTPFLKLQSALGGRKKLAVTLVALIGLGIVIVPSWMFADSIINSATSLGKHIAEGTAQVPPPSEGVQDWPIVGNKIYTAWAQAAENLTGFIQSHKDQVKEIGGAIISKIAGAGLGVLQLLVSILIAAAFLSNAEAAATAMNQFFRRLAGDRGGEMLNLSVATIRSVATGVLGIALIQAVLAGLGMIVVGVPAAGLWALFVLVVAIAQLPPWLILGPVIVYVFSVESSTVATLFMIWAIVVSFLDMVLKPIMLGRGVEAPMLVILLGAIGGMILSGIIGLFTGAVVLAMSFKLFQAWLQMGEADAGLETGAETESGDTPDTQQAGISE